jgi:site-specific recombinase XerC
MIRECEAAGKLTVSDAGEPTTIEALRKAYLDNAENGRKLKGTTVDRYRIIFRQLEKFAEEKGIRFVRELDFVKLLEFRSSWKDGALSGQKKLERLRAIFGFAKKMKIVADNPALELETPIVRQVPTLPFTHEEMGRILVAVEKKITTATTAGQRREWRRVRALILFLRYSGLRISDAVGCGVERIRDGKLFLYTAKTGQEVYVPLPEMVVKALEECEPVHECYWFRTAQGTVEKAEEVERGVGESFPRCKSEGRARAPFSRYVCCRVVEERNADRERRSISGPCECSRHSEALFGLGEGPPGASGGRRDGELGKRSTSGHGKADERDV